MAYLRRKHGRLSIIENTWRKSVAPAVEHVHAPSCRSLWLAEKGLPMDWKAAIEAHVRIQRAGSVSEVLSVCDKTPAADSGGAIPASTAAQPATGGAVENPPAASADECERCDGSGQISGRSQPVEGLAYMDWEADCDECGGTGRVAL